MATETDDMESPESSGLTNTSNPSQQPFRQLNVEKILNIWSLTKLIRTLKMCGICRRSWLGGYGKSVLSSSFTYVHSSNNRSHLFNERAKYTSYLLKKANYRACKPPCPGSGSITVKYIPYIRKTYKDHDYKNMALQRPLSPHLDIYGPTLPAMTSIAQRATGIGLSAFSFLLSAVALSCPRGVDSLVGFIQNLNLPEGLIIAGKTIIAFCFTFHFFIGLRFVAFNLGKLLDLSSAYKSAYLAIVLAAVTAVLCGLIGHAYTFQDLKVFPPKG